MNRSTLNLLAALTVLIGSWALATPKSLGAQEPGQACCTADKGECCGDACRSVGGSCSACTGFWGCLFF